MKTSLSQYGTILTSLILMVVLSDCQRDQAITPVETTSGKHSTSSFTVSLEEAILVSQMAHRSKVDVKQSQARVASPSVEDKPRKVKDTHPIKDGSEILFYIINYDDDKGFTIVSADKRFVPIVAEADKGLFKNDTLPGVKEWMFGIKESIKKAKKELKEPYPWDKKLWESYLAKSSKNGRIANDECYNDIVEVGPLTQAIARYTQNNAFSFYSPGDGGTPWNCNCGRKDAGCGPVAMAIVERFHRHPDLLMTVNGEQMWLDDAGYNSMPASMGINEWICERPADDMRRLAMLIRLNGAAANTGYGVGGNCAAWTYPGNINNALTTMGYSNGGWWADLDASHYQTVKTELTRGFPVIFTGSTCNTCLGSAHIWVADGYRRYNYGYQNCYYDFWGQYICDGCQWFGYEYVHMNWGWNGQDNGWYVANYNINGYHRYLRALVNIRP